MMEGNTFIESINGWVKESDHQEVRKDLREALYLLERCQWVLNTLRPTGTKRLSVELDLDEFLEGKNGGYYVVEGEDKCI